MPRTPDLGRIFFSALLPFMCTLAIAACSNGDGGGGSDPTMICKNSCEFANDGECDDGGEGSDFNECQLGTDCGDCGPRTIGGGTGGTDGGISTGCPAEGCPMGQSCVLDQCIDNGGGGSDNGEEGASCTCSGTGQANIYMRCSGTEDGCSGYGGTGQLSCYAGETGAGTCRYGCSESDEGVQGACPATSTCSNSGLESISGSNWYVCF